MVMSNLRQMFSKDLEVATTLDTTFWTHMRLTALKVSVSFMGISCTQRRQNHIAKLVSEMQFTHIFLPNSTVKGV